MLVNIRPWYELQFDFKSNLDNVLEYWSMGSSSLNLNALRWTSSLQIWGSDLMNTGTWKRLLRFLPSKVKNHPKNILAFFRKNRIDIEALVLKLRSHWKTNRYEPKFITPLFLANGKTGTTSVLYWLLWLNQLMTTKQFWLPTKRWRRNPKCRRSRFNSKKNKVTQTLICCSCWALTIRKRTTSRWYCSGW